MIEEQSVQDRILHLDSLLELLLDEVLSGDLGLKLSFQKVAVGRKFGLTTSWNRLLNG